MALWVEPLEEDEWPHREPRLGCDTQARLLETVVLVFESGDEMVIDAMPARRHSVSTSAKPASLPPTVIDAYAVPVPRAPSCRLVTSVVVGPEQARKLRA